MEKYKTIVVWKLECFNKLSKTRLYGREYWHLVDGTTICADIYTHFERTFQTPYIVPVINKTILDSVTDAKPYFVVPVRSKFPCKSEWNKYKLTHPRWAAFLESPFEN